MKTYISYVRRSFAVEWKKLGKWVYYDLSGPPSLPCLWSVWPCSLRIWVLLLLSINWFIQLFLVFNYSVANMCLGLEFKQSIGYQLLRYSFLDNVVTCIFFLLLYLFHTKRFMFSTFPSKPVSKIHLFSLKNHRCSSVFDANIHTPGFSHLNPNICVSLCFYVYIFVWRVIESMVFWIALVSQLYGEILEENGIDLAEMKVLRRKMEEIAISVKQGSTTT